MKTYTATFKKKDGSLRKMNFAKLKDLPRKFLTDKRKSNKRPTLTEGTEIVWDLEAEDFRAFNWNTVVGKVKEAEINFVL